LRYNFIYRNLFFTLVIYTPMNKKKNYKKKTQKLYNMKGCSSLAKYKKGGKNCWGSAQKGGCGCGSATMSGGRTRRNKKMLAYPASNSQSQAAFTKGLLAYNGKGGDANGVLAYTGRGGNPNPNLPYGQIPPFNKPFPPGVSQPQNLRGGGVINPDVVFGPVNVYGGKRKKGGGKGMWPDGLVGSAWGPKLSELPGVDRISGDRNYFSLNDYKHDPQTQGVINGRALSGGKTRKRRGGGLLPQDLVNMGRQAMFGLNGTFNALVGTSPPANPMPYKDQLVGTPTLKTLDYYRL